MIAPTPAPQRLGLAGALTHAFIRSPLTPLFLLASFALGLVALVTLPREEEPQISVPMVDIMVRADGLRAEDAVKLVTEPLETIVKGINGVEHVYSQTRDDSVMVTARFLVGTPSDAAILRVHEKVRANMDRIPAGIPEPLIVGRGIDDVAIVVLTLTPKPEAADRWDANGLTRVARELRTELAKLDDVGLTYIVGEQPEQIRVEPDPEALARYGVTLQQLAAKLEGANRSFEAGQVRDGGRQLALVAGQTLQGADEIGNLLVTTRDGRPVYVRDVARITLDDLAGREPRVEPRPRRQGGRRLRRRRPPSPSRSPSAPAPTPWSSPTASSRASAHLKGGVVPERRRRHGHPQLRRDGQREGQRAPLPPRPRHRLHRAAGRRRHRLARGDRRRGGHPHHDPAHPLRRPVMGYTLNRVSLFALIFSIGILVDDAIVVIENIARHWAMNDGRTPRAGGHRRGRRGRQPDHRRHADRRRGAAADAVRLRHDGPLHEPDPGQRLGGDDLLLLRRGDPDALADAEDRRAGAASRRMADGTAMARSGARAGSTSPSPGRSCASKRGPGSSCSSSASRPSARWRCSTPSTSRSSCCPSTTSRSCRSSSTCRRAPRSRTPTACCRRSPRRLAGVPEVVSFQTYAGTAAPFNFNGLVRHYALRTSPELGDVQVNLTPKAERQRASHDIALDMRRRLADLPVPDGHQHQGGRAAARPAGARHPARRDLRAGRRRPAAPSRPRCARPSPPCPSSSTSTTASARPRRACASTLDQDNLEFHGVEQRDVYDTLRTLEGGATVGYSHRGGGRQPIPIRLELCQGPPRRSTSGR